MASEQFNANFTVSQETIPLSLHASKTSKETTQIYKTLLVSLRLRCMARVFGAFLKFWGNPEIQHGRPLTIMMS